MKIICIGAGASGLFFSLNAANNGHEVILLESNERAGRKLAITGKGRCNITNDCPVNEVIEKVLSNPKFLYSAVAGFSPRDAIEWFNAHGCELKTERGNRVFPVSDQSSDVVNALLRECDKAGVKIIYRQKVTSIRQSEEGFKVFTKDRAYAAEKVVIATGGKSYPLTGSTGDGYAFALSFHHSIVPPVSALCPIKIKERIDPKMTTLTLKNVALTASAEKFHKTLFGDMEFLPNAITGPISLSMSSLINRKGYVELSLDFKPALDNEKLNNRILREISETPNESVMHLIRTLLPSDIIPFFVQHAGTPTAKQLNSFTKEDRAKLVRDLKAFPLTYDGLDGIEKGIVTSGGVSTKEINSKTMESKLVPGLYFIGEVIDVDAFTGGFNLQIALSTAYAAARYIG
ncbi:MAG: NAD(P)/FAD-dependent oxidoreductase [Bacilli bacterium]|nr:NAD(P)/FAD-dependent oxidoreductase [Bacilli bacterium]